MTFRPRPHLIAAALATALAAFTAAPAQAAVTLQTTYAAPIAATNAVCTAEPRDTIYGTSNYDAAQPVDYTSWGIPGVSYYDPANAPASLNMIPASQAGGHTDLCVGFTLTPDLEPTLVRDSDHLDRPRLQDTPPKWADDPETHVEPAAAAPGGETPVAPQGDDLRTIRIALPLGYAMAFATAPQCSAEAFGAATAVPAACPAATRVGDALVRLTANGNHDAIHAVITGAALSNLAPGPGEVGRLGVAIQAAGALTATKLIASITLDPGGSGRLIATLTDVPRVAYDIVGGRFRPLYLEGLSLRAWGAKADHAPLATDFGVQGTRCDEPSSSIFDATTYAGLTSAAESLPATLGGCSALSLPVTAAITGTSAVAGSSTGATVDIALPQAGGNAPTTPAGVTISLPDGFTVGTQLASDAAGLPFCAVADFGAANGATAAHCPDASAIGTASLTTPFTATPFTGALFIAAPTAPGAFADLLIEAAASADPAAARIKLVGHLGFDDAGRVQVDLPSLPPLHLSDLSLTLRGGSSAAFTAPRTCGDHDGAVTLSVPGAGPTTLPLPVSVPDGCEAPALTASLGVATTTRNSGGRTATSVSVTRPDRAAHVDHASFTLPPGLLLAAGALPSCSAESAAAAACPAESQLGSIRLLAGAGEHLTTVDGSLYLAATPDGAYAGAVMVAAAKFGDIDRGAWVAPVRFDLAAGNRLVLDATLPTNAAGVPLALRTLTVDLDREGIFRQPTACGDLPVSATLSGEGARASTSGTISYGDCVAHGFAPGFSAVATGATGAGGRPQVAVTLAPRAGDAGVSAATVTFPAGYEPAPASATTTACPLDAFQANACPASSKAGSVGGRVAVSNDAVGGDLYRVRIPGESGVAVGLNFAGRLGHHAIGRFQVAADGRLSLRIADLPDLPFSRWALVIDGGATGTLQLTAPKACPKTNAWVGDLRGHGGQTSTRSIAASCPAAAAGAGQSPVVVMSISRKTGLKLKINAFGEQRLQAFKLTLPTSIRFKPATAKRKGRAQVALIGAKAKPSFSSGSLLLAISGGAPSEVVIRVRPTAYTLSAAASKTSPKKKPKTARMAAAKKQRISFRLRLAFADGTVQTRTVAVPLP